MGLILDSSLLIAHERDAFDLAGFLAERDEPVLLAAITASELLHGCHRAVDARLRKKRSQYVEWMLSEIEVAPFALEEARQHARIWAELARKGKIIGSHDLIIAATALSLDFTVASLNLNEFIRVPGLAVVKQPALQPYQLIP